MQFLELCCTFAAKSKQSHYFINKMYRDSFKCRSSWYLNKHHISVAPSGHLQQPCEITLRSIDVPAKWQQLSANPDTGARNRNHEVLRSLVLCRWCRDMAPCDYPTARFTSSIYEGYAWRLFRVHPLGVASRKKYYRTHFYPIQTISYFQ